MPTSKSEETRKDKS
jgi:hypothetical protein